MCVCVCVCVCAHARACVRACVCAHLHDLRSLFWLCFVLCFVMGYALRSGEVAHQRVHYYLSLLLVLYSQSGHKQAPGREVYRRIHLQSAEGCDFSASTGKHTWTGGTWRKASRTCNQNTTEIKTVKKIANDLGRYICTSLQFLFTSSWMS